GERVVGSSMVHHKDEKSECGDRKDAPHHNRGRPERLFFEAAERGKPGGRLPGSRRRCGRIGVPVCLGEARSEIGQQVDAEAQSLYIASLIAKAVLQQLERFGLIALAEARGIEPEQTGKYLLRHTPPE